VVDDIFRDVPAAERRRMCAENAEELTPNTDPVRDSGIL